MDNIMERDLYELIGAEKSSSTAEIKKAYRKKALSCHPDKHPDNPRAAELFHELTRALEILTDDSARAAYDKVVDARLQAKQRVRELDAKRKKFKEELEAREDAFKRSLGTDYRTKSDEERLQAEVERLRKEGSRQVEEEVAMVTKRIQEELRSSGKKSGSDNAGPYRVKIKWKVEKDNPNAPGYDYNSLYRIFSKYGDIVALVVSPSGKGRALVEYEKRSDAETAASTEIGFGHAPLTLERLWKVTENRSSYDTQSTRPSGYATPFTGHHKVPTEDESDRRSNTAAPKNAQGGQREMSDAEFELSVLANLRRAEERKRLLGMSNAAEES